MRVLQWLPLFANWIACALALPHQMHNATHFYNETRIIVLQKAGAVATHGRVHHEFRKGALHGYCATVKSITAIQEHPDTLHWEIDTPVKIQGVISQTNPANWGLDRINQLALPLDSTYTYNAVAGANTTVYIIDTGINVDHIEFGGRASWGANFVSDTDIDDEGHGTHVTGIAIGASVGVAKAAKAVAVKVLDAQGEGFLSTFIAGLNWVYNYGEPYSVINMSVGGDGSIALTQTINVLVDSNFAFVIAAGNEARNACLGGSMACNSNIISVGASDMNDDYAVFSNYGSGISIVAPGVDILSAYIGGTNAYFPMSGTSMATPFVAGAVAIMQSTHGPLAPSQVLEALQNTVCVNNALQHMPFATVNKLLYTLPLN